MIRRPQLDVIVVRPSRLHLAASDHVVINHIDPDSLHAPRRVQVLVRIAAPIVAPRHRVALVRRLPLPGTATSIVLSVENGLGVL